jgi:hypothetical protein
MRTAATDLLGIDIPIFGFSHCRDVVAALTNAGGCGVLGAVAHSAGGSPGSSLTQQRDPRSGQLVYHRLTSGESHHDRFAIPGDERTISPRPLDVSRLHAEATCAALKATQRRRTDEAVEHADDALSRDRSGTTERPSHVLLMDYCILKSDPPPDQPSDPAGEDVRSKACQELVDAPAAPSRRRTKIDAVDGEPRTHEVPHETRGEPIVRDHVRYHIAHPPRAAQ